MGWHILAGLQGELALGAYRSRLGIGYAENVIDCAVESVKSNEAKIIGISTRWGAENATKCENVVSHTNFGDWP